MDISHELSRHTFNHRLQTRDPHLHVLVQVSSCVTMPESACLHCKYGSMLNVKLAIAYVDNLVRYELVIEVSYASIGK